jgi:hypothetical protein
MYFKRLAPTYLILALDGSMAEPIPNEFYTLQPVILELTEMVSPQMPEATLPFHSSLN